MSAPKITNYEELLSCIVTANEATRDLIKEDIRQQLHEMREMIANTLTESDSHRNKMMELLQNMHTAKATRTKPATVAAGEAMPESALSFWRNNYIGNDACAASLADNECVQTFLKEIKKATIAEITTAANKNKFATRTWDAMIRGALKGIDFDGNEVELTRQSVTEMMAAYIKSKSDAAAPDADAIGEAIDDAAADETADEPATEPEPAPVTAPKPAAESGTWSSKLTTPAPTTPARTATAKAPVSAKANKPAAAAPAPAAAAPKAAGAKAPARRAAAAK